MLIKKSRATNIASNDFELLMNNVFLFSGLTVAIQNGRSVNFNGHMAKFESEQWALFKFLFESEALGTKRQKLS